jgi:TrmH family RNA methyltransferase
MISKSTIKLIKSLAQKKYRKQNNLFVAESPKLVKDILGGTFELVELFVNQEYSSQFAAFSEKTMLLDESDFQKISFLEHPQGVLALLKIPKDLPHPEPINQFVIALDGIQDPGNLGTIVRLAHWFGISEIVCSETCADVYNPKVVQASMGAIAFVNLHYIPLVDYLKKYWQQCPVYGALMNGQNIYQSKIKSNGIILLGNEGKGISNELLTYVSHPISIPDFPLGSAKVDSLNVSMAASIILSEFRRTNFIN